MLAVTGYTVIYLCFVLSCDLMVNAIPLRERVDVIEQRIGVVETRMNYELATEISLEQNFEDLNKSMIDLKNDHSNLAKSVKILKSSRLPVMLGLEREKQWTRDQVKNLTAQMGEHTDRLDLQFLDLTNQINSHNDQLTKNYSKLRTNMNDKTEREKQWTRDQVKKMENVINKKMYKTDMLISSQQKEMEALKETVTNLASALIATYIKYIKYTCPSGWQSYSSYCYLSHKGWKTVIEARAYCKLQGATLPDIENQAENYFVYDYASISFPYGQFTWIGYTDEEKEGNWISERTGHHASFTNFADGQPNGDFRVNCLAMRSRSDYGKWYDMKCGATAHLICKKDATIAFKL